MLPPPDRAPLTGIPFGRWMGLLRHHRRDAAPARRPWITACSLSASALGRAEDALYATRLAEMDVDPAPIFVLGLWGSGADALRDLLVRDPAHTALMRWQAAVPTAPITAGRVGRWLPGGGEAAEDEVALAKLTGLSPYLADTWPERAAEYERYLDFLEVRNAERARWKNTLVHLVKKLMLATGRRVVSSSRPHGARIRLLLETFPEARFVHVHQHPYAVFGAMRGAPQERVALGERVYERLIDDRRYVPPGQLVEIACDDLRVRPLEVVAGVYSRLGLPEWERAREAIAAHPGRIGRSAPERLLPRAERDLVWARWRRVFDTYGYDRELVCGT